MAQVIGGTTKKTVHLARDFAIAVAIIIAVAAFFVGWSLGKHQNKAMGSNPSASTLLTYKNQGNGFQLQYPSGWSSPSFSKTDFNGGTSYMLGFYKSPVGNLKYSIVMTMVKGQNAVTDTNVKTILKNNKSLVTISDNSSYATVANAPKLNISSLSDVQIVNLTKIGVTAVSMTYQINGSQGNCPQNKFATNSSGSCIERTDYDTVNQVLKSIKNL